MDALLQARHLLPMFFFVRLLQTVELSLIFELFFGFFRDFRVYLYTHHTHTHTRTPFLTHIDTKTPTERETHYHGRLLIFLDPSDTWIYSVIPNDAWIYCLDPIDSWIYLLGLHAHTPTHGSRKLCVCQRKSVWIRETLCRSMKIGEDPKNQ